MSRQVAHILNGNTENIVLSAPAMAAWITDIEIDDDRRADPMWVSKITASERAFDPITGEYTTELGNQYSIERYMPVPYKLTFQLDIWTTNMFTKLQILEQILCVFNTSLQLQQNENPLDWSNIFEVFLTDTIWTNRTIPMGGEVEYDFATLKFEVPVWINPPAKEQRRRVIDKIITRVFDGDGVIPEHDEIISQCNIIAGGLKINAGQDLSDPSLNTITLLNKFGVERNEITWDAAAGAYGTIIPGESGVILKTSNDIESTEGDVHGTIVGVDGNKLTVRIDTDTVPARNPAFSPVNQFIDPVATWPGNGLPAASAGQRYIFSESITSDNPNWGPLVANANDIVRYSGTGWNVIFDSNDAVETVGVQNLGDSQYYTYNTAEWIYTFLGEYTPGYWIITNLNILPS